MEEIDSFLLTKNALMKRWQKIWAGILPPSFGQNPKEQQFFLGKPSLTQSYFKFKAQKVEIITMIKNVPPGDPATEVLGEWGWGSAWDGLGGGRAGEQGGQHHHHHSQKFTKTISTGDDHIEQWDKRGNNQCWQVDGDDDAANDNGMFTAMIADQGYDIGVDRHNKDGDRYDDMLLL